MGKINAVYRGTESPLITRQYKPVGDMARAYTGDADAVLDYGLLIAT